MATFADPIVLEEPNGTRQVIVPPWGPRGRPWKFRHTDGRYFEAVVQQGPTWIYRTREPAVVAETTIKLTRGAACSEVATIVVPTAELGDRVVHEGREYVLHARYPDGFLHYHHDDDPPPPPKKRRHA